VGEGQLVSHPIMAGRLSDDAVSALKRMQQDAEYLPWLRQTYSDRRGGPRLKLDLDNPIDRAAFLLALMRADDANNTQKVMSSFTHNLEAAFAELNRNIHWISFATNDLPLVRELPQIVYDVAVEKKLNKAQVKALKDTYRENPTETRRLIMRAKAEVVNAISALKWQGTASEMISFADDTGS
jgi:hypothetical protein